MKIYVSLPREYKKSELKSFLKAVEHIKKLGHSVVDDREIESQVKSRKSPKDETVRRFKIIERAIKDTDIVITEASKADGKTGFEIARALDEKKTVIVLQKEDSKNEVVPFHGNKTRKMILSKYDEKNITSKVEKSLEDAKGQLDTKFILIISPEIDRYLDWASQTKRMHKAQIVRKAIEEMIKKDKEYKTYLAG